MSGGVIEMVCYPTLISEMSKRGIKKKELAEATGLCYRTVANRLSGKSDFTLPDAQAIRNRFFPGMDYDVLFARADQDSA